MLPATRISGGAVDLPRTRRYAPSQRSDAAEILRKLWRRKGLLLGVTISVLLVAVVAIRMIPPRYSAQAWIAVNGPEARPANFQWVVPGLDSNAETVQNESYVLLSRIVTEDVVERLNLYDDPEFNAELRETSQLRRVLNVVVSVVDAIAEVLGDDTGAEEEEPVPLTAEEREERRRNRVVGALLNQVVVQQMGRSSVLSIEAESENPGSAARIANSMVDVYLDKQLARKGEVTAKAGTWLNKQITELADKVEASEKAVEEYRRKNNLYQSRDVGVTTQQLTELNTQLVVAQSAMAEAEARLTHAESILRNPTALSGAPEVLRSPIIQSLKQQLTEAEGRSAEVATKFGPKHPRRQDTAAQIADIKAKIKVEVGNVVESLRNEARTASARYKALRTNFESLEGKMGNVNEKSIRLHSLERDADANRALYMSLLERSKETSMQQGILQNDARLISHAVVPERPSFPPSMLLLVIAGAGGLFLGSLIVLLVEGLDRTFRTIAAVESATGLPVLTMVPALGAHARVHDQVLRDPSSPYSEAFRKLDASMILSGGEGTPRTIMVASAIPREGKTAVCVSLGRMLARSGCRVVVVDCDWRRSRLHRILGKQRGPSLADFLTNTGDPQATLRHDAKSGLDWIPAGGLRSDQSHLLTSVRMRHFLNDLATHYDLVLLDTAPVLVAADALRLSRMVDETIFVARWGHSPRDAVLAGLRHLFDSAAKVSGIVLTQVDSKRSHQYGYGDYSYPYLAVEPYLKAD